MSPRTSPPRLPDDLICYGILPRLPVRSLARFAAVCKAWRDLILHDAAFAALQEQSPSPASTALARFHHGRLEVLAPGGGANAASVAPPDPSLSFLTAGGVYEELELCAFTGGLLCLKAKHKVSERLAFCVCNPATGSFHLIRNNYPLGVAGLAYDPAAAAARGYDVVVAVVEGVQTYRFYRFSSRAARSGWRAARDAACLAPYETLQPKPAYAGGRVHWFTSRGNVVWHDVNSELYGTLPPPPPPRSSGVGRIEGNMDLAVWRGRLRLACASTTGVGVWELASYGGAGAPARWDPVHWRRWCSIPGVVAPERCFMWSVVPRGLVAGGEETLGLALRWAHVPKKRVASGAAAGRRKDVWYRALVRYDRCTGATPAAVVLRGKEVHDSFGTVFGYHSSLAALPSLNWDA